MKRTILISGAFLLAGMAVKAQDSIPSTPSVTISGYLESYYSYDFNKAFNNTKASFIYSHNRNNELNINLGLIRAGYSSDRVRANFALAAGTYMNANYAAEPGVLQNIYEANAGVKLTAKSDLWLDAGVLPSHIGWESAIGKDNYTLSRSLAAENSPYFETGVKLGYTSKSGKWYLSALVLNGWQRIERVDGNRMPAFGTQVSFKPSASVTLNSSTFIGNDKPDSISQWRYFHDLYGQFQMGSKWTAIAGFDIGAEQKSRGSHDYNIWYTPVLVVRYAAASRTSVAVRGEYYRDKNGVIVSSANPEGFRCWGYSANIDHTLSKNVLWRTEIRDLKSKDRIFLKNENSIGKNDLIATMSLCIGF